MAIVLGTILGVVARYGYVWFATGAVAHWEIDGSFLATVLGTRCRRFARLPLGVVGGVGARAPPTARVPSVADLHVGGFD